jgi:hypothetical protein
MIRLSSDQWWDFRARIFRNIKWCLLGRPHFTKNRGVSKGMCGGWGAVSITKQDAWRLSSVVTTNASSPPHVMELGYCFLKMLIEYTTRQRRYYEISRSLRAHSRGQCTAYHSHEWIPWNYCWIRYEHTVENTSLNISSINSSFVCILAVAACRPVAK